MGAATAGVATLMALPVSATVALTVDAGFLAVSAFEAIYDANAFSLQDKLDEIGENIDEFLEETRVGQAISTGVGKMASAVKGIGKSIKNAYSF